MSLLEIALAHAARGWYVFPCKPRDKFPITQNGWHDASREEAKIRAWWTKTPDANVGIACGMSGLAVLDIDSGITDDVHITEWASKHNLPFSYTVRSGRRPGFGVQVYFEGAIPDVKGWEFDGCKGDIKSLGGYVIAAGSIHPSGEAYQVIYGDIQLTRETPQAVRALKSPNVGSGKDAAPVEGGRNNYLTSVAGKLRNSGLGAEALELALLQHNADVCNPPLPEEEVKAIAAHVARYDVPEPEPIALISSAPAEKAPVEIDTSKDAELRDKTRPVYPDHVWNGTAYGEFADLCAAGNYVPKKFYAEALRTAVGAVISSQLSSDRDGVNPRCYTVLIGTPGSGKGTALDRVREFFNERWDGLQRTEAPLMWADPKEMHWRSRGIGACIVNLASAPGLMKALEPRKLKKDEQANPLEVWTPVPRFISLQEEMRGLFANFANEATGAGLESVLCELFDRETFSTTVTKDRGPQSGEVLLSLLGGITPEGWESVFSQVQSTESGFMSRVNIIASEENRRVADLGRPDFEALRRRLFPMIQDLAERPRQLSPSADSRALMNEWFSNLDTRLPEGVSKSRLNIHAWRAALHRAWLLGHKFILPDDTDAGIQLAEYQADMREWYMPSEGETKQARWEAKLRKAMRGSRRITLRELRRKTNANRAGAKLWNDALQSLVRLGEIRVEDKGQGVITVILLKSVG